MATAEDVGHLRATLDSLLVRSEQVSSMIRAYGGAHRCFERFLLARANDVEAAAEMFRVTFTWRAKHGLDDGSFALDDEVRRKIRPLWPGALVAGTTGWQASPTMLFRLGNVDPTAMLDSCTEEEFQAYYIDMMEVSLRLQNASNSAAVDVSEATWYGMVEVYDCSGLSLSQLHPAGLAMLSRVLSIGQQHYPENLRKAYFVNAPFFFSGGFAMVSGALAANTVAKISIRSDDGGDELLETVGGAERLATLVASVPPSPLSS